MPQAGGELNGLRVLVVDDEQPIREELSYLLSGDSRVEGVTSTGSGAAALKHLERGETDAVFLDIAMPGLSGLDVARVLGRFKTVPSIVFVTAHDGHAVEAFEINAVDYLLKPVRVDRLAESIRRIVEAREQPATDDEDETIPVELGGVTQIRAAQRHRLRGSPGRLRPPPHRRWLALASRSPHHSRGALA